LSVDAIPYTVAELEAKKHNFELVKNADGITVHVDVKQMGVGGDCSWGCDVLDVYKVHPDDYAYEFYIQGTE
jgi:beta-galactosidase